MQKNLLILFAVAAGSTILSCGGRETPPAKVAEPAPAASKKEAIVEKHLCERPISFPEEVWPRIEEARALSDDEFKRHCGFKLLEIISSWRCPPSDLLYRVVKNASTADEEALVEYVLSAAVDNSNLARHIVASDIIGWWSIGQDTAVVQEKAAKWRARINGDERLLEVVLASEPLHRMLPKVTRAHELRCMLEVNPLGFAVDCTPIHKESDNIELNWKAKSRDGLLEDLALTRCTGSRACKKIEKRAAELKELYLALMREVEVMRIDVYKEQLKAHLVLRPFD